MIFDDKYLSRKSIVWNLKKKYHSGILNWFLETFIVKIYLHIVSFKWHEQKVTSDIKTHGTLILSRWKL